MENSQQTSRSVSSDDRAATDPNLVDPNAIGPLSIGPNSIGLALGGGAARGLAHVLMLEALDEMGLRPVAIAGTSMGAIVGAAYAAGLPGAQSGAEYSIMTL